jgi:hypothetical protein
MAVRAISLSVCHRRTAQGLPNWIQMMFGGTVFYSTISIDDINAQSGWSLKTEKIRLNDMYALILLTQYGIYFWHELASTLHYIS